MQQIVSITNKISELYQEMGYLQGIKESFDSAYSIILNDFYTLKELQAQKINPENVEQIDLENVVEKVSREMDIIYDILSKACNPTTFSASSHGG